MAGHKPYLPGSFSVPSWRGSPKPFIPGQPYSLGDGGDMGAAALAVEEDLPLITDFLFAEEQLPSITEFLAEPEPVMVEVPTLIEKPQVAEPQPLTPIDLEPVEAVELLRLENDEPVPMAQIPTVEIPDEPVHDETWVQDEWKRFDWQSMASMGPGRAEDTQAAESAWSEGDWEQKKKPIKKVDPNNAEELAAALDNLAKKVRAGALKVDGLPSGTEEAALAAALAALLAQK